MLSLSGISKSYGGRVLFNDVSLQLNREDRAGLVGPNGAGKTTLFKMILGEEAPDAGEVTMQRGVKMGYLPQENAPAGDETVLELATAITPEFKQLRWKIKHWDHLPAEALNPHDNIHARYDELDGFGIESRAKHVLLGLSFREKDFERPLRELSGGWVMRAYLARLLVQQPDLLLLDEPTNHLDLESLLWLQQYLKTYPGAILMISHDREFLNEIVGSIIELRMSRLLRYRGTYDDYLVQREANEAQMLAAYKNQQREIAHLMEFVERFRAKNTKAAQAQSKLKQIERMEKLEAPDAAEKTVGFSFPQPERSGLKVITLETVDFAYSENVIYRGMEFEAERGQRIVLVGPNGAGKSTLLKLLAGVLEPQAGARNLGYKVKPGYFSQYRVEMLHPERTVLEEALDTPQRVTEQFVRTLLGSFLFRGDDVFKPVSVLSGGEKSRLALVKLLLDPPNLLLMDEPTTHLDMASTDALLAALDQFEGTLIFISHDVYFIRSLANHVVHVKNNRLTHYPGGYQYYLDKTAQSAAQAAATAAPAKTVSAEPAKPSLREQRRLDAERRNAWSRAKKEQQTLVTRLEKEIADLEQRQADLTRELESPDTYAIPGAAVRINAEMKEVMDRLPLAMTEWEAAGTRLAELEAERD